MNGPLRRFGKVKYWIRWFCDQWNMQTDCSSGKLNAVGTPHLNGSEHIFLPTTSGFLQQFWNCESNSLYKHFRLPALLASHISSSDDDNNGWRVNIALIYLWHFYCGLCTRDEWTPGQQRLNETHSTISAGKYIYIFYSFPQTFTTQPAPLVATIHFSQAPLGGLCIRNGKVANLTRKSASYSKLVAHFASHSGQLVAHFFSSSSSAGTSCFLRVSYWLNREHRFNYVRFSSKQITAKFNAQ